MKSSTRCARLMAGSGLAALLLAAHPAYAQIEEVVVTAQKRETTILATPATVQVLSSAAIDNYRINDLQSLNRLVPGFQMEMVAGGNMSLAIRGIGTTSSAQSYEQSVAPYVDGVYLGGNNRDFSWPLFDIGHIEVFKGTQSGIAGQNTSVGIVNITTRAPGDQFGGYATVGGEFINEGYNAEGAVDLPVSDRFHMRLSGYFNQRGGWIHNAVTGQDLGEQQMYAGRINAVWEASDTVSVHFFGEYDHDRQIGSAPAIITYDRTGAYTRYSAPYFAWKPNGTTAAFFGHSLDPSVGVEFDGDSGVLAESFKGATRIDVDLWGGHKLTSITAGSFIDDRLSVDQDFSQADIPSLTDPTQSQWLAQTSAYHQVTEEVRLTSPQQNRLTYIVGGWYRNAALDKTTDIFVARAFPLTPTGVSLPFHQIINNYSGFADAEFKVTDKVKVGGTIRYTYELKEANVTGLPAPNPNAVFTPFGTVYSRIGTSFWDGSARITYTPVERLNLYALYSHGTKTGALVDLVAGGKPQTARPEVVETYEIGAKAEMFNRRLALQLSAFRMITKDYQDAFTAPISGTIVFFAQNTNLTTHGVDAQVQWNPTDALSFATNIEYLDARNTSLGGIALRSPKWQVGADARYSFRVLGFDSALFANVAYKGSYQNLPLGQADRPLTVTPAYATTDVGFEVNPTDKLKVSLLCKNCSDTIVQAKPATTSFGPPSDRAPAVYAYPVELRTVLLRATYNF